MVGYLVHTMFAIVNYCKYKYLALIPFTFTVEIV